MGERFMASKRQVNSSSQLRTQFYYSQSDQSEQLRKNKTDSQLSNTLKKISNSVKNIHSSKKESGLELDYLTSTKSNGKYSQQKFPNLEKKTDVQRVRWFSRQNRELEQHQMFLKFLESTNSNSMKIIQDPQPTTQNQNREKTQLNFCDKYFIIKTPVKPMRMKFKTPSNQQITLDSTVVSCKKKKQNCGLTLEGFFLKNNELKRHCQTQQDTNSVLDQMGINKIQHINLYSSMVKGVKNDIFHNQYKSALKDIFETDDLQNQQDLEVAKELQKKSIFQNPFSQHTTPHNQQELQLNKNNFEIITSKPTDQLQDATRRKNKIKRVLLQINVFLHWMIEQKLNYKDILSGNVFQEHPYYSKNSKICFQRVKANDFELVTQFIQDNKYLVYDYDHYKLTLLHHSVIRDYSEITAFLLENKAEVNCKDIQGRTPLYYAIKGRCNICVQVLLFYRASPWGNHKNNYDKYLEFLDPKVRDLYKKAKTIHLRMQILPVSKRINYWSQQKLIFTYK